MTEKRGQLRLLFPASANSPSSQSGSLITPLSRANATSKPLIPEGTDKSIPFRHPDRSGGI
ncbi:MAG: hypothetical protein K2M95_06270 [Clostridiales bacterium]|nr:hypothetical protein [Clostridiales bacterium]